MTIKRPVSRYHGGKFRLAPWIISQMPSHKVYVEPFGGMGSVLLRKPRAPLGDVYNDLDGDVVNLFRILRHRRHAAELARLVKLTPYSRKELALAQVPDGSPMERARRFLVRGGMSFGSDGATRTSKTGFRNVAYRKGDKPRKGPAIDWMNYAAMLPSIVDRLQGVVIECRSAFDLLDIYDGEQTLFYFDPPYLHLSRSTGEMERNYQHGLTGQEHVRLSTAVRGLKGMVMVSGYDTEVYRELYEGFTMVQKKASASARRCGSTSRVECLWLSSTTVTAQRQTTMEGV